MDVHIFVGMFQGLVDEVKVFRKEEDAITAWSDYTGREYTEMDSDGENVDGSEIVE